MKTHVRMNQFFCMTFLLGECTVFGEAAADESVFVGAGRSEMARPGFQATNLQPRHFKHVGCFWLNNWTFEVFQGSQDAAAATFWKPQGSLDPP
jgi:hypothetical protein